MTSLAILGAGNMGSAIAFALLESGIIPAENMGIADKSFAKLESFAQKGVRLSEYSEEILEGAKFVVLAVKPQDAAELLRYLRGNFEPDAVLISIAAGLSTAKLQEWSGLTKIVRVMPNTPALVRMGVSGMYAGPGLADEERDYVRKLLESFSIVIPCENENKIDAITALSGSGPAYYFRILEIMAEQAENFGFSQEQAQQIALGTLRGAGELARNSGEEFSVLREKVTSKGGTTEAALKEFSQLNLEETLKKGIASAFQRAKELSS